MNEEKLKKQLRTGVVCCIILGMVVVVVSVFIIKNLHNSLINLVREQMQAEAIDYSDRITRQIDKDFQALNTLASFIEESGMADAPDMINILSKINDKNEFVTMGYFKEDGTGNLAHLEKGIIRNVDYRELCGEAEDSIQLAYEGEANMSRLFHSTVTSDLVFIYSVPIMEQENVKAVLSVSAYVEVFASFIRADTTLNGNGTVQLLNRDGEVLLSSGLLEKGSHVFSETYFSKEYLEEMGKVVKGREEFCVSRMQMGDHHYVSCIKSLGINDWFLLCIHNSERANQAAMSIVQILMTAFIILFAILLSLLVFSVTMLRKGNDFLMRLAYKDRLTGADNMSGFIRNLSAARRQDACFSIVSLNIRQFKFINEIYGVKKADQLLCLVGDQIREKMGEGEFFARERADVFFIYLREQTEEAVEKRVGELIESIKEKYRSEKREFQLRMYAGAYIHEEGREKLSNEMLITRVSFAMGACEVQPMERMKFYNETIHGKEELENYIENHMEQALLDREFQVYLQPKMDLKKNQLGGAEALVRWKSKEKGMIFPDVFIPQFEKNGFCVELDLYMVEQVFILLRAWMDQGLAPFSISVNQSKLLFFQPEYLEKLQGYLDQYQVPAEYITLEILEGIALEHPEKMNEKIRALHSMGFKISMDDFGSGYSSLNTLGNLEIDELKLDRGFLLELSKGRAKRFRTIMSSIMMLSRNLGISTVTEGVETEEDEKLIRKLGCDYAQGYLYSRPIPAQEFFEKYLSKSEDRA